MIHMSVKITGREYPLDTIFDGHLIFSIPLFQRPYAWTAEQAGELLNDLLDSMDSEDEYFLGSIVLIKEDDPLKPEAQVVDGQQRLITLTILFSVLRYRLRELHNEISNDLKKMPTDITKLPSGLTKRPNDIARTLETLTKLSDDLTKRIYKEESVINEKPATYLLTLRRDESFFRDYIQNDNDKENEIKKIKQLMELPCTENDSQKNIKDNTQLFNDMLKVKSELELKRLIMFIFRKCFVIVVSTPDSDSAFRIFAILNDRGLNLSHADKLKSELIGEVHELKQQDAAARLWEGMEDQLGRDSFKALFYHIRMIAHPEKLRLDILKEFRRFVIEPIADPLTVIEEIVKYAKIYDNIRNAEYVSSSCAEEINIKLKWLNEIDNKDWVPPAIFYMSLHKDPCELNRFFVDLERLAAGLMIRRADVNKRIRRYAEVLNAIKSDQNLYEDASPLQLTQEERKDIIERLDGDLYLESKFRRYVLLRLNDAFLEEGVKLDYDRVTIEHVLPQSLPRGGKWEEWFSESDHIEYVHKVGNLILLTGPKNHGNDEFKEKQKKYLDEKKYGIISFPMSLQAIKHETEWTKEVIDRRQKDQLDKLKEIWRL